MSRRAGSAPSPAAARPAATTSAIAPTAGAARSSGPTLHAPTASAATIAIATRFNIRTRLRPHCAHCTITTVPRAHQNHVAVSPGVGSFAPGSRPAANAVDETAAAAAADLPALAAGRSRFLGRPLVSRPLLMGGAPALARDLTLLLRRHRGEPAAFLAFSRLVRPLSIIHAWLLLARCPPPRTTYGAWFGSAGGSWTGAGVGSLGGVSGASPALVASWRDLVAGSASGIGILFRVRARPAQLPPGLYQTLCHGSAGKSGQPVGP